MNENSPPLKRRTRLKTLAKFEQFQTYRVWSKRRRGNDFFIGRAGFSLSSFSLPSTSLLSLLSFPLSLLFPSLSLQNRHPTPLPFFPIPFPLASPLLPSSISSPPFLSALGPWNPARGAGVFEQGLRQSPSRNRIWCILASKYAIC